MQSYIFERFEERQVKVVIDYHGEFSDDREKKEFADRLKMEIADTIRRVIVERANPK